MPGLYLFEMKRFDQPEVQAEVYRRLTALTPSSQRWWGNMTAQQALCHLVDSLEAVRGDRTMTMPPLPALQRLVMKWGALYLPVPWPCGIKTAPENDQQLRGTPPSGFEADRARLLELAGRLNDGRWVALHPIMGAMTNLEWQRWAHLHFDYQLRQFSV